MHNGFLVKIFCGQRLLIKIIETEFSFNISIIHDIEHEGYIFLD